MDAEGSIVSRSARVWVEWETLVCASPMTVCSVAVAEESNGNNKKAANRERSMLNIDARGRGEVASMWSRSNVTRVITLLETLVRRSSPVKSNLKGIAWFHLRRNEVRRIHDITALPEAS